MEFGVVLFVLFVVVLFVVRVRVMLFVGLG